jgi:hypothetical protein
MISGTERASADGAPAGVDAERTLVVDIGGGSCCGLHGDGDGDGDADGKSRRDGC